MSVFYNFIILLYNIIIFIIFTKIKVFYYEYLESNWLLHNQFICFLTKNYKKNIYIHNNFLMRVWGMSANLLGSIYDPKPNITILNDKRSRKSNKNLESVFNI